VRLSQFFPPKQRSTGNNRQIRERQTEGQAHQEAERLDPSRYDDDGQNVGDENVSVEVVRRDRRHSRLISCASLSSLNPAKLECLRCPSLVELDLCNAHRLEPPAFFHLLRRERLYGSLLLWSDFHKKIVDDIQSSEVLVQYVTAPGRSDLPGW